MGLLGHSDGDVLLHAVADAIYGAMGDRDIGFHFPPGREETLGISSRSILAHARGRMAAEGFGLLGLDAVVVCEAPRIAPLADALRASIAGILAVPEDCVSVKGKTTEGMGFEGRGEGISAWAVALLRGTRPENGGGCGGMTLSVFNTMGSRKEPFVPLVPGKVRMYVCGVTVYDLCHIGHARANVAFDIIVRYLRHTGYDVTYVRNFTDIDDKIIRRATQEGSDYAEVTKKYIDAFYEDFDRLGLLRPDVEPKATEHIPEIVALVARLVREGKAYEVGGDVYYSVKGFPGYGKLSGKNVEDLRAGRGSTWTSGRTTPWTSPSGRRRSRGSPRGKAPGAPGARDGTSSAPPCR